MPIPGDNFDHWVLPDVFGGTAGLLLYDAQPGQRAAVFEHFDAFGVRVGVDSTWSADHDGSRYRWRSQEGSETDDLAVSDSYGVGLQPPTLVYMQTRHYDPSLGRFIMADSIPMGAFSPQGLNRYAYCTNDPVNGTDPAGTWLRELVGTLGISLGTFIRGGAIGGAVFGAMGVITAIARGSYSRCSRTGENSLRHSRAGWNAAAWQGAQAPASAGMMHRCGGEETAPAPVLLPRARTLLSSSR